MFHARRDLPVDRILPIQEIVVFEVKEKLAVGRIRIRRPRRADRPTGVGDFGKFGGHIGHVGPARSGPANVEILFHIAVFHVTRLGHEPVDDPMKADVVIGPGAGQFLHPRTMQRGHIGQQFDRDCAILQHNDDGILKIGCIGHQALLFFKRLRLT